MDERGIRKLLLELGVDGIETNDTWVNAKCPLAAYTHAGGVDTRPSFGISISDEGRSAYYCFGCSPQGRRLERLFHNIFVASFRFPWEAAGVFLEHENFGEEDKLPAVLDVWEWSEPKEVKPLPAEVLKRYPLLQTGKGYEAKRCREYLEEERGVPVWVQNLCRVRFDWHTSSLIFPLTDIHGNVFVMRKRLRKEKSICTVSPAMVGLEGVEFPKLKEVGAWFNMFTVDWSRPVMLVEGEIDAMKVISFGFFNVVASATSSVTDSQIDALHAPLLLLGYDSDKGGQFAHRRIRDRVGKKANMIELDWSVVGKRDSPAEKAKDAGDVKDRDDFEKVLGYSLDKKS